MNAEQLLTKAINTLNRWDTELAEEGEEVPMINKAMITIIEYALANLDNRQSAPVRNAIALAYAVLEVDEY